MFVDGEVENASGEFCFPAWVSSDHIWGGPCQTRVSHFSQNRIDCDIFDFLMSIIGHMTILTVIINNSGTLSHHIYIGEKMVVNSYILGY